MSAQEPGESIDADAAYGLASYAKAFASGSMYKTFKEGTQFIGNLIDLVSKGKDIKDGVEKAMGSDTPKPKMVSVPIYGYSIAGPMGERGSAAGATVQTRYEKDTIVPEPNVSGVVQQQTSIQQKFQLKADSINTRLRNRR
ncbi:hypothetical protein ACKUSY_01305 [Myroides odoratus]